MQANSKRQKITFLGLGAMGLPMATNLALSTNSLIVWNRTTEKANRFAGTDTQVSTSPQSAVEDADIVFLMLESGRVVQDVLFDQGVAESIPPGATVIDMSSIPPDMARNHAERLAGLGIHYLDAPVSGGTSGAKEASLAILVGGDAETFAGCKPVLKLLGHPSHLGPVGAGQTAKLANQVIVAGTLGAVSEGLALAKALGLDLEVLMSALRGGFADSRILQEHGKRMVSRDFSPGATINIQVKDLITALSAAESVHSRLPVSKTLLVLYRELVQQDAGHLDHSALWLWYDNVMYPS